MINYLKRYVRSFSLFHKVIFIVFQSHLETDSFLEQLRNLLSLSNEIPLKEIISFLDQLTKENLSFKQNEDSLRKDLENVNEQLINIYNQCEQLQENNKQLLLEKQTLNPNIPVDGLLIECQKMSSLIIHYFRRSIESRLYRTTKSMCTIGCC